MGGFPCRTGNPFFLSQRSRLRGQQICQQKLFMMEPEHEPRSKLRFSLLYIGHYMLPSYTGTITSHCQDSDEPACIMGCQTIWTLDTWFPNPFPLFQGCYFFFEVTTWTVPFLHRDHHANPEPFHFILKSSKRVLKPFTGFRYKKRPPKTKPQGVAEKKETCG